LAPAAGSDLPSDSAPIAAPATDPFHEHQTPPPDPFHGPGAFDPGTPGGGHIAGGGSSVSATPEPGAVLLLGTGFLSILGVLRKRRLL
jgi:hypothetical protein